MAYANFKIKKEVTLLFDLYIQIILDSYSLVYINKAKGIRKTVSKKKELSQFKTLFVRLSSLHPSFYSSFLVGL